MYYAIFFLFGLQMEHIQLQMFRPETNSAYLIMTTVDLLQIFAESARNVNGYIVCITLKCERII